MAQKPKSKAKKKPAARKRAAGKKNSQKAKKPLIQKMTSILRKRIKQKQRLKPKNEYRYNHKTGHMNYIFAETAEKKKAVGIKSEPTTFGRKNMRLKEDPKRNPKAKKVETPHVRNGIISTSEKAFKRKESKTVKFSKDDMANVKAKIRHYKKEYKRKTIKERDQESEQ